jgi:murein L,D-transpeptidase YcbB/YkuD
MTVQELAVPIVAAAVLVGVSVSQSEGNQPEAAGVPLVATSGAAAQAIAEVVASRQFGEGPADSFAREAQEVDRFYQLASAQTVWVKNGELTQRGRELVSALKNASARGLDPRNYGGSMWDARIAGARRPDLDGARLDVALTVSLMRYASDVRNGRWNPGLYNFAFDAADRTARISDVALDIARSSSSVTANLEKLDPSFAEYKRLEAALVHYQALAASEEPEALADARKPVEPGGVYDNGDALAKRLRFLGDLAPGASVPLDGTYSGALVTAVKRFQDRHGLEADGRLGSATIAELNTPMSFRVRQIELAMERWRWLPRRFQRGPILVNIPEFQLRAYDDSNRVALQMRVITGQAAGHATPRFSGELKYVVFGPYWNVPPSIQFHEIVPKIRKDRSYLANHGYEVVTPAGELVETGEVSGEVSDEVFEQLKKGRLAVRQTPGGENALGRVKFMFPNENNVYMHDTNSRSLFARTRRDLSHGCVRVEKPQQLAEWVLQNEKTWTSEKIEAALKETQQRQANLKTPVPVLILYHTAWVNEHGEARFFRDIYKDDAALEARIAKGSTVEITSGGRGQRPRG